MFNWLLAVHDSLVVGPVNNDVSAGNPPGPGPDLEAFGFGMLLGAVIASICLIAGYFVVKSIKKSNQQIKERKEQAKKAEIEALKEMIRAEMKAENDKSN